MFDVHTINHISTNKAQNRTQNYEKPKDKTKYTKECQIENWLVLRVEFNLSFTMPPMRSFIEHTEHRTLWKMYYAGIKSLWCVVDLFATFCACVSCFRVVLFKFVFVFCFVCRFFFLLSTSEIYWRERVIHFTCICVDIEGEKTNVEEEE